MAKLSEEEEQKRIMLYNQGLSDTEIAKKCGVTSSAIAEWRLSRKLPKRKEHTDSGVPMEKALTPQQCRIVRQFLKTLVYAKNINPDLDLSDFIQQYRKILNGYITRRPYKHENKALG
jgi:hypothetical protein